MWLDYGSGFGPESARHLVPAASLSLTPVLSLAGTVHKALGDARWGLERTGPYLTRVRYNVCDLCSGFKKKKKSGGPCAQSCVHGRRPLLELC